MGEKKKPFKTIDEELSILESRGLVFQDKDDARQKLLENNYYTIINGYKHPFVYERNHSDSNACEKFKEGTTFDKIYALYEFDCELRALFLKYILRIEHELKSVISHKFASRYPDVDYPKYLSEEYFDLNSDKKRAKYQELRDDIEKELSRQREKGNKILLHYDSTYEELPPWILISIFSFGMVRKFYACLKQDEQNEIARSFALRVEDMLSSLSALNIYRNACAHDERIYSLPLKNKVTFKGRIYNKVFVVVLILKQLLDVDSFMSFYSTFELLLDNLLKTEGAEVYAQVLAAMGTPVCPDERKAILGKLQNSSEDTLSEEEFSKMLSRYIVPLLPTTEQISPVSTDNIERENLRCRLVEQKNGQIYFSKSVKEKFSFSVNVSNLKLAEDKLEVAEKHLSALIDYIHVFWNANNLRKSEREKFAIAFPNLCEQAYVMTICKLLCETEQEEIKESLDKANTLYYREVGTASCNRRKELTKAINDCKRKYSEVVRNESNALRCLYTILDQICTWANKTYEGQKKTFGIIFCSKEFPKSETFNYIDFLKSDYSATINDGIYSAVELYADGTFKAHIPIPDSSDLDGSPSIPYPFNGFASLCTGDKVGILLIASGDILIIKNTELCYMKHNGFWLKPNINEVVEWVKGELGENFSDYVSIIYQTITDLSYSRSGACIGIVREDNIAEDFEQTIKGGLLSDENIDAKRTAIKSMISREDGNGIKNFYELNRPLRRELMELDGATVFSKSGLIHAIGTIIKLNNSGSNGGGRTAAAMQLSEFGLAIKISQDGYIQLFKDRKNVVKALI